MLSNIFGTEQFSSSSASDEYSFENFAKQSGFNGGEERGDSDVDMDLLFGDFTERHFNQQTKQVAEFGSTNALFLDDVAQQALPLAMIESEKKADDTIHSSSFQILKKYGSRCRRLNGENMNNFPTYEIGSESSTSLSIGTLIQLAAAHFINSTTQFSNEVSVLNHPYPSSILSHSVEEDTQSVQLLQNLLLCAEKVDQKQYTRARKILLECDRLSSPSGTPVQRLVFYFTEALYEKIDRETGTITPKGLGRKFPDPLEALKSRDETLIAFHKELPLSQINKFAGIQAVVDNLADASKVHFIVLEIRKGIQCTILMQALASRIGNQIEFLKITSIGTKSKTRASIEETGRQLKSFAQSLGLKFLFNIVMVEDILDLDKTLFELDHDEVIAVYPDFALMSMIGWPDRLEHLMRLIRALNPCVMVVTEVEANCNSPVFVDRFVEALVYYGAFFESMADCLKSDENQRRFAEGTCFGSSIRNVIATEGEERKIRHVGIDVWRAFFMRFGFEERELSMSSVYQANLVLKSFSSANSFTFDTNGKSLIIGWKGTPLSSLSAWKLKCPY